MSQNLKSVQEYFDEAGPTDVSALFADWSALIERLAAKVHQRFALTRDPSTDELESFSSEGGPNGSVRAYSGPEIDWMVHSHMENSAAGFVNVHLTIWLGPHVKVPHFGMALGAFPMGWMFLDSVPRTYLSGDVESYNKYYAPLNDEWEQVKQNNDWLEPSSAAAPSSAPTSRRRRTASWVRATPG